MLYFFGVLMKKIKAVGLLSGGLDSTLAAELLKEQGIEIIALNFKSPFCLCDQKGKYYSAETAKKLGLKYRTMQKGKEYLKLLRNPKHGYGRAMNPCIDCRTFTHCALLKKRQGLKENF